MTSIWNLSRPLKPPVGPPLHPPARVAPQSQCQCQWLVARVLKILARFSFPFAAVTKPVCGLARRIAMAWNNQRHEPVSQCEILNPLLVYSLNGAVEGHLVRQQVWIPTRTVDAGTGSRLFRRMVPKICCEWGGGERWPAAGGRQHPGGGRRGWWPPVALSTTCWRARFDLHGYVSSRVAARAGKRGVKEKNRLVPTQGGKRIQLLNTIFEALLLRNQVLCHPK